MKEEIVNNIKNDCLALILKKNINLYDLSFELGISYNEFINIMNNRKKDLTIYLNLYNLLLEW